MPIYNFKCPECGVYEFPVPIGIDSIKCEVCNKHRAIRLFTPPTNIIPDIEPFLDDNMDHEPIYIRSRRHQKEELKKRGLVQLG